MQASVNKLSKVLVWDVDDVSPSGDWTTVLWRSFSEAATPAVVSIPSLIEENADVLRKRYLAWIYELGEFQVQGRSLVNHLQLHPGVSYWWMTLLAEKCNFAKSPQIDDAIRLMVFTDWATGRSISTITLASANPALAKCVELLCSKLGMTFKWQRQPKRTVRVSWVRRVYQSLPLTLQALAALTKYSVDHFPLIGVGLKEWQQTNGQITFVSYFLNLVPDAAKAGRYESRYWAHLPNNLRTEGCITNWLHLYVEDPFSPSAIDAADTISRFNNAGQGKQIHTTLETFLTFPVILKTLRDWRRLARIGRRLQRSISATSSEGLVIWPLFSEDWRQSTGGVTAIKNVLYFNLFESAIRFLPKQRVGVYLQENQGWELGLIQAWKAAGQRRLIGCPHSTVRFWDLRYFFDPRSYNRVGNNPLPLPNHIAINGKAATEAYLVGGYPEDDLVQVEALRFLHLDSACAQLKQDFSESKQCLRLLVLGDYLLRNTRLQMRLLEQASKSFPMGMVITVKPHPACPIRASDYPGLRLTVVMEPIEELLAECDLAYASSVTSAAVDAYCAGVPVVSVLDPNTLNLSPLRGCVGAFSVSTPEELVHVLTSAMSTFRSAETKPPFFTIDSTLPRWRKLLVSDS